MFRRDFLVSTLGLAAYPLLKWLLPPRRVDHIEFSIYDWHYNFPKVLREIKRLQICESDLLSVERIYKDSEYFDSITWFGNVHDDSLLKVIKRVVAYDNKRDIISIRREKDGLKGWSYAFCRMSVLRGEF